MMIDNVIYATDKNTAQRRNIARIFAAIRPLDVVGKKKIRVGGNADGGYIMLEPDEKNTESKIAYSLGVGDVATWDYEMAEKGYRVFQYDGTIEDAPKKHPLLSFYKYNVAGKAPHQPDEKTIGEILRDNHHENADIILQMDIEGAEWDVLQVISENDINRFEQMIIEFHGLEIEGKEFEKQVEMLEKINRTHQAIHLHGNNNSPVILVNQHEKYETDFIESIKDICFLPVVIELSYVRRFDPQSGLPSFSFAPSNEEFPCVLDRPNNESLDDIYIGRFNSENDFEKRLNRLYFHFMSHEQRLFACGFRVHQNRHLLTQTTRRIDERLQQMGEQLNRLNEQISQTDNRLNQTDERLNRQDERISRQDERISRQDERISRQDERISRQDERLSRIDEQMSRIDRRLNRVIALCFHGLPARKMLRLKQLVNKVRLFLAAGKRKEKYRQRLEMINQSLIEMDLLINSAKGVI